MKYMILSDLHGSALWCRRAMDALREEKADRLILLGDLLYHGPRNDLPGKYDPKQVIELLNAEKNRILCVRGNCDTEVDQTVLEFPIMAPFALMELEDRLMFMTHGHQWNAGRLPPLQPGDILLHGHTHVPECRKTGGIIIMNPGSAAIPKSGSQSSYMTLENGLFLWKDLSDGRETDRFRL